MNPPAAFRASYSDWKLIRTRKVVQIVLEVPVEEADAAYQVLGGMPHPGESVWCAVARLQEGGDAHAQQHPTIDTMPASLPDKPARRAKREWRKLTPAEQAGIRCSELPFQAFLRDAIETFGLSSHDDCRSENEAAEIVRDLCHVQSRSQINEANPESLRLWQLLEEDYRTWQHAPAAGAA